MFLAHDIGGKANRTPNVKIMKITPGYDYSYTQQPRIKYKHKIEYQQTA